MNKCDKCMSTSNSKQCIDKHIELSHQTSKRKKADTDSKNSSLNSSSSSPPKKKDCVNEIEDMDISLEASSMKVDLPGDEFLTKLESIRTELKKRV